MERELILDGNKIIAEFYVANTLNSSIEKGIYKLNGINIPYIGMEEYGNHDSVLKFHNLSEGYELEFHKSWDWIIPAFDIFSLKAELQSGIPRTRISFCCDFMAGVWRNEISLPFDSLIKGIEWYNSCKHLPQKGV